MYFLKPNFPNYIFQTLLNVSFETEIGNMYFKLWILLDQFNLNMKGKGLRHQVADIRIMKLIKTQFLYLLQTTVELESSYLENCRFGNVPLDKITLLKFQRWKCLIAKFSMKTGIISNHSFLETTVVSNISVKCMGPPVCNYGLCSFKYFC